MKVKCKYFNLFIKMEENPDEYLYFQMKEGCFLQYNFKDCEEKRTDLFTYKFRTFI